MSRPTPRLIRYSVAAALAASALAASAQTPEAQPAKAEQMSIPAPAIKLSSPSPEGARPPVESRAKATAKARIWSAVLIASNSPKPKDPPPELRALFPRLKRVFGYNQFELAGHDDAPLQDGSELKLTPCRAFWIDLKARHASVKEARGGYLLNLRLLQDEKPIVDTVAIIAPESPLFFRGPMYARGQIIIVLQVLP
jgi:hypothetical protein